MSSGRWRALGANAVKTQRREYERGLLLIVLVAVVAAALYTWRDIESDRATTIEASAAVTDALAESIENHISATLRDAENATLSAALLIEDAGGPGAIPQEKLHRELKRELWNDESTARLVALGKDGVVYGSSAELPAPVAKIDLPKQEWKLISPSPRPFRIGFPQRSLFDGELVLPYTCDVLANDGTVIGAVRSELKIENFSTAWAGIGSMQHGAVVFLTLDGTILARAPLRESNLGTQPENIRRFVSENVAHANSGRVEFFSRFDNVTRYTSWRRMGNQPLVIAVGIESDAMLAPWRDRTRQRIVVLGLGSTALLAMAIALAWYLRRLQRSEDSRHELELRYSAAIENSTIAVGVTDAEGRFIHMNPASETIFGYTSDELIAMPPETLLTPESRATRAERMRNLLGRDSYSYEIPMLRKDGRHIWVMVHATRVLDLQGNTAGFVVHSQDVTDRKDHEARMRALNEELEQRVEQRTAELLRANQDLEAFSYSAAHDIRSPLAAIAGFVDLLARDLGEIPEKAARRIEIIKRQLGQTAQTVEDLLALSRSGNQALRMGPVDVSALVAEVREQLDMQNGGRDVRWIVHPLPDVWADRGSLRQALANMIGNAHKYSRGRDPAVIEIGSTSVDAGVAEFYIRDNGIGFDNSQLADLFAPFRRLKGAGAFEGSGIGLAIVQRIIERNGGRVWAEGAPGEGAVFRFTLPASDADHGETPHRGV